MLKTCLLVVNFIKYYNLNALVIIISLKSKKYQSESKIQILIIENKNVRGQCATIRTALHFVLRWTMSKAI